MPSQTQVAVAIALMVLVTGVAFLVAAGIVIVRRARGHAVGPRLAAGLAFLGAVALGTMFLFMSGELALVWPIPVLGLIATLNSWRQRRWVQAAAVVVGFALPWTMLWGYYLGLLLFRGVNFESDDTWRGFLVGLVPVVIGLFVAARGDPPAPAPSTAASAGQPGSRSFGNIAVAILEPGSIGPISVPSLAALLALVGVSTGVLLIATFFGPGGPLAVVQRGGPGIAVIVLSGMLASVAATEAYLRAMPARSRRAFEAFSWFGEQELANVRQQTGRGMPTTRGGAERWLRSRPERLEEAWIRAELLSVVGRHAEAHDLAARIPAVTAEDRALRAATQDVVDFMAGGDGDIDGLRAAVAEIDPDDTEARLRGEVMIAASVTRNRMADGRTSPGDAIDPLLDARDRLGARADGQLGRALRRKLLAVFLASSLFLSLLMQWFYGGLGAAS